MKFKKKAIFYIFSLIIVNIFNLKINSYIDYSSINPDLDLSIDNKEWDKLIENHEYYKGLKESKNFLKNHGLGNVIDDSNFDIDELNREEAGRRNYKFSPREWFSRNKGKAAAILGGSVVVGYFLYSYVNGKLIKTDQRTGESEEVNDKNTPPEVQKKIIEKIEEKKEKWSIRKKIGVASTATLGATALGSLGYDWWNESKKEGYKGFRDYSKKLVSRMKNKIKKIFA